MVSPLGLNVLRADESLYNRDFRTMFFMDNWAGAARYQAAHPNAIVIHRVSNVDEGSWHLTPDRILSEIKMRAAERQDNRVFVNLCTEPGTPDDASLKKLNDEVLKALRWAKDNNVRVAAPHLAHYGIEGTRWLILEPMIDFIASNPNLFILTCDEYGAGHMFSGVVDTRLSGGNEYGHIQPETWKASNVPKYYHCGRITDYFRDLVARGKRLPITVITESGLDALGDVTAWRNSLLMTAGYHDRRGWKSISVQLAAWYGVRGWSVERSFYEMLKALWLEVYLPWPCIKGLCIYCYGSNNDPTWDQFRVDGAVEFLSLIEQFNPVEQIPVTTPVAKPTNAGNPVLARLTDTYNIRTGPSIAHDVVRAGLKGEILNYFPEQPNKTIANSFTWVWVETPTGNGWMALQSQFKRLIPAGWPIIGVRVDVPFVSQLNSGVNNCGEAALAMILKFIGNMSHRSLLSNLSIQDVINKVNNSGDYASFAQLISAAAQYDVTVTVATGQSLASIRSEIDAARPVIALVERGNLPGASDYYTFTGAHFVVVVGYTQQHLIILDPLKAQNTSGDLLVYPNEFREAWQTVTGNSAQFQMAKFDPSEFAVVEPPLATVGLTKDELDQLIEAYHQTFLNYGAILQNVSDMEANIEGNKNSVDKILAVMEALRTRMES